MNRSDVEKLLVEAKRLTHHSHYVIVGSLSILGAVPSPPPDMAIESRFRDATMLDEERSVAARSIDDDRAWLQGPTNKPSKRRRSREDDRSR